MAYIITQNRRRRNPPERRSSTCADRSATVGSCRSDHRPGSVELTAQSRGPGRAAAGPRLRPGLHRPHGDARLLTEDGWHDARLTAYQPITLDPATSVLHYGQAIFEGLKAYAQPDGRSRCSGPSRTPRRFRRSAASAGHARAAGRAVPRRRPACSSRWTGAGCRPERATSPLPAPADVRHRRRSSACGRRASYLFVLFASPGRRLLPRRGPAGVGVALDRVRAGRARRHRRGQVRRQLRRRASSPRRRPPSRAATRWSGSTRSSTATSRRWAA